METLLSKIEDYGFECEAGPLKNCEHWIALRATLSAASLDAPVSAQEKPVRAITEDAAWLIAQRVNYEGSFDPATRILMSARELVRFFEIACIDYTAQVHPQVSLEDVRDEGLITLLRCALSELCHYNGCPQDAIPPTGECNCYAGELATRIRAAIAAYIQSVEGNGDA